MTRPKGRGGWGPCALPWGMLGEQWQTGLSDSGMKADEILTCPLCDLEAVRHRGPFPTRSPGRPTLAQNCSPPLRKGCTRVVSVSWLL